MGINVILPIIIGIGLMLSIGTTVAPSIIEDMKISKVVNKTIENQEIIKNAIIRYIQIKGKAPEKIEELETEVLLKDYHNDNFFNKQGYTFKINSEKGYIKIKTKIDDNSAMKYFENNIKYPNKPNCIKIIENNICQNNEFETFYLLDDDIHDILLKNLKVDYSDPEYIKEFTKENLGKKDYYEKNPPKAGDKDNVVDLENKTVTEYILDESGNWTKGEEKTVGGIGSGTGVFISNEKVHCKDTTLSDQEVFVVNQNTGLGEIVWVAPDDVLEIQRKIFDPNLNSVWTKITTEPIFEPNNICTSKVTSMLDIFYNKQTFNKPLNRWDTSNVTDMDSMFTYAYKFNNNIGEWDVSNVTNMYSMFSEATSFNQPLNNWNVSKVTNMDYMFLDAWEFNQPLNNWNVSNVTSMDSMFEEAYSFNQPLNNWDVSNVTYMDGVFNWAEKFNQPLNNWDVSNVTYMGYMFYGATIFNQDISNWDVSKVTDMYKMFDDAQSFNKDLSSWCVSQIALKPYNFDNKANAWILPKPKWGEPCPPNP